MNYILCCKSSSSSASSTSRKVQPDDCDSCNVSQYDDNGNSSEVCGSFLSWAFVCRSISRCYFQVVLVSSFLSHATIKNTILHDVRSIFIETMPIIGLDFNYVCEIQSVFKEYKNEIKKYHPLDYFLIIFRGISI